MSAKQYVNLPVSGPLNTNDPSTAVPPGTLRKAIDTRHVGWGNRMGGRQQTWTGRIPSSGISANVPGACPDFSFDGTNTYVKGTLPVEQKNLGNRWTLDIAIHAFAARSTANAVQAFKWNIDGSITAIEVGHYGSSHANANKGYAIVKTTSSAGVVAGTYTLVGGTVPFAAQSSLVTGGTVIRYFMRLIRDGTTLTLLDSTGATATDTTLLATEPHLGGSSVGNWYYGRDTGLGASTTFNGLVLRVLLRDVASAAIAPQAIEHIFPRSPSVRFFGTSALLTSANVADQSSFGSHGVVSSAGAVTAYDRHYPIAKTVQGVGSFTDSNGQSLSAAMVGGLLCHVRTR